LTEVKTGSQARDESSTRTSTSSGRVDRIVSATLEHWQIVAFRDCRDARVPMQGEGLSTAFAHDDGGNGDDDGEESQPDSPDSQPPEAERSDDGSRR
jgi:hypothetical protein